MQVDCTGLVQVDSSAVAVLLAWHRAAAARNLALSLRAVPAQLSQLASLYGVDGLLGLANGADPLSGQGHHHRH
ncbi:hypothetical protein D3C72_2267710 [compost metagenome]